MIFVIIVVKMLCTTNFDHCDDKRRYKSTDNAELRLIIIIIIIIILLGPSILLWTQELLILYAVLPVGAVFSHGHVIMLLPPPSTDRPSSSVAIMPYSTPVEFVFDWLSS